MESYELPHRSVRETELFSQAVTHLQVVFKFGDAVKGTALKLWAVLFWAASRAASLSQARHRLQPGVQDQTLWNLLRTNMPKQAAALERRLNELLRLPFLLPALAGRALTIAIDYHHIPYYGSQKKVAASCVAASPIEARRTSTPTRPCASSSPAGGTHWP